MRLKIFNRFYYLGTRTNLQAYIREGVGPVTLRLLVSQDLLTQRVRGLSEDFLKGQSSEYLIPNPLSLMQLEKTALRSLRSGTK